MITIMKQQASLAGVTPLARALLAGNYLFRQGDPTFGIFLLRSGRVRLQRITPDGTAVSIHLARPGETFAEASLFSDVYHCDAVAEVAGEVLVYPKERLAEKLRSEPEALWAFARDLAVHLQKLRLRYEIKHLRAAPERVLQFLRLNCTAEAVFPVNGALKDVAAELGLTPEAFYRALALLEKRRIVVRSAGAIRLTGHMN